MGYREPQNPGLGGIDELTNAEELFIQNLAGLTYAQGDILYYDGSNLINLGPGNSGEFLKTQGAGANPVWDVTDGGSGSMTTIKEAGAQVGGADIVTLDFGAGFDLTETPDTEINITLDFTEVAGHDLFTDFASNEHFLQSAITEVGTVITGVWNATDIAVADGGTGAGTAGDARTNLGVDVAGTDNSVEASIAEVDTGTNTSKHVSPDSLQGSIRNLRFIDFWLVDTGTDVATGTTLVEWRAPFAGTIVQDDSNKNYFMAWNATAGSTGTMVIDIHKNGTTIMTTNKLDIETGEKTTADAATQPDLTTTTFAAGDIFTIDTDAIHTTPAKGLWVRMAVRPT